MMETDEFIYKLDHESFNAYKDGKMNASHAIKQMRQLIGHARRMEMERNQCRDHLNTAIQFCIGRVDEGTLNSWKREIGCSEDQSIHDVEYKKHECKSKDKICCNCHNA